MRARRSRRWGGRKAGRGLPRAPGQPGGRLPPAPGGRDRDSAPSSSPTLGRRPEAALGPAPTVPEEAPGHSWGPVRYGGRPKHAVLAPRPHCRGRPSARPLPVSHLCTRHGALTGTKGADLHPRCLLLFTELGRGPCGGPEMWGAGRGRGPSNVCFQRAANRGPLPPVRATLCGWTCPGPERLTAMINAVH